MAVQRRICNKKIKVVKVLLIIIAIFAVLVILINLIFDTGNKGKSKNFSEKDYKIISTGFKIDEGTFEIKDITYCPQLDNENPWYTTGGDNEAYNVNVFMDYDDIPNLEKNYNIKAVNGNYNVGLVKSKFSNDVGVRLYLRCDYDDPNLCIVSLDYHGHNDELDKVL